MQVSVRDPSFESGVPTQVSQQISLTLLTCKFRKKKLKLKNNLTEVTRMIKM